MHKITVVSLGAGSRNHLTLGALEILKKAKRLILRTGETDAARYLSEQGIAFETLDSLHESCEDFDGFITETVNVLTRSAARANAVYAVLDAASDETVRYLREKLGEQVEIYGGSDLSAPLLQAAGAALPVRICSASSLTVPQTQDGLLIVEMNTKLLAGECKLKLSRWYGDETKVLFFPPSSAGARTFIPVPLCEIDRQGRYDHTTAVFLPEKNLTEKERFDMWDLVSVLCRLRGENGCPWDKAQTHQTLSRYLIEEAYEVSQAVSEEDWEHVAEELGDVLLQVVFQANIGEQYGTFDLSDVTTSICHKMIERHTHVFGLDHCDTPEEVLQNWEKNKQAARGNKTVSEALADVSAQLPALLRAEKLLKKSELYHVDAEEILRDDPAYPLLAETEKLRRQQICAEEALHRAGEKLICAVQELEKQASSGNG